MLCHKKELVIEKLSQPYKQHVGEHGVMGTLALLIGSQPLDFRQRCLGSFTKVTPSVCDVNILKHI